MFTTAPRTLLAAALGLGALSVASEAQAAAAYVCEIRLYVHENSDLSTPWGSQVEFDLYLTSAPFCGGHAVGQRRHIKNYKAPLYIPNDTFNGVLNNTVAVYEDTALLGTFLQLHSAAALGLAVEVDTPNGSSITLRHHGLTIAHDRGPLPPEGNHNNSNVQGYVCRSKTQARDSHGAISADGHQLEFTLTANPGCAGGVVHQRSLMPRTQSALPRPNQSGRVALLSYQQGRLQEYNLATVALGHALMIAQATEMWVQVEQNSISKSLDAVSFRATPTTSCPQPPPSSPAIPQNVPKKPHTKPAKKPKDPTPVNPIPSRIPDPKRPLPLPGDHRQF